MEQPNLYPSITKALALGVTCLALTGCIGGGSGGGSGDSGDSNDGSVDIGDGGDGDTSSPDPDPSTQFDPVDGEFLSASSSEGMSMAQAAQLDGYTSVGSPSSVVCGNSTTGWGDTYYKTDKVRVYGDSFATEEQLERTARGIHHFLEETEKQFGLEAGELQSRTNATLVSKFVTNYEPENASDGWKNLETAFDQELGQQVTIEYGSDAIAALLPLSASEFQAVTEATELLHPDFDNLASLMRTDLTPYSGQSFPPRYDDSRVVACVDLDYDGPATVDSVTRFWGPTIGAEFEPEQLHHAMVHFVQRQLTGTTGYGSVIDHWFSEGQAVHLAGETVASADNYDLLESPFDENSGISHPESEKHAVYGLAYQYLTESTPDEKLAGVILDAYHGRNEPPQDPSKFEASLNSIAKDPDGNALTVDTYESEWFERMERYFSN